MPVNVGANELWINFMYGQENITKKFKVCDKNTPSKAATNSNDPCVSRSCEYTTLFMGSIIWIKSKQSKTKNSTNIIKRYFVAEVKVGMPRQYIPLHQWLNLHPQKLDSFLPLLFPCFKRTMCSKTMKLTLTFFN